MNNFKYRQGMIVQTGTGDGGVMLDPEGSKGSSHVLHAVISDGPEMTVSFLEERLVSERLL